MASNILKFIFFSLMCLPLFGQHYPYTSTPASTDTILIIKNHGGTKKTTIGNISSGSLPAGVNKQTLRYTGTKWDSTSNLKNDGIAVAINMPDTFSARLNIYAPSGFGRDAIRMHGDPRGDGTNYLTYFDDAIPGLLTDGFIVANGEIHGTGNINPNILGFPSMIGAKSDLGTSGATILSQGSGNYIYAGYNAGGNRAFSVDDAGNVRLGLNTSSVIEFGAPALSGNWSARITNGTLFGTYSTESFDRFAINADHGLRLGPGSSAFDTKISRTGVAQVTIENTLKLIPVTAASVGNSCLFIDSADNKLKFKDNTGTVQNLY
ncbi:MAG TPA: hypothetical protein PK006_12375 [Saprospiraceae bacterium]|nr:hypothetical protein [Saprospiraceae bacterium]